VKEEYTAAIVHNQRRHKKRFHKDDLELTLLAAPTFIWYVLFCFLPMFGVIIAFKNFSFQAGMGFIHNVFTSPWSGLKNFEFFFKSNDAWLITRNTIGYNLIFIILNVAVPVTLAILINQLRSRWVAKAAQTAMLMPYFMSWVVITYFVSAFMNYDLGLFNQILRYFGMENLQWYAEKKYWPFILIFLSTWKMAGYSMMIYLATITGMDASLYEAAHIDGASRWQQIRYITLPLLKPVMIMMFILAVGRIFNSDFGLFYQVPKGSPSLYEVTETFDVYIYRALTGSVNISRPSAAAFIQSVAGCITILIANGIVRKLDKDSAII